MKDRISLDDPNYNQSQQITVQDNKAKILWIIIGIIAVIVIVFTIALQNGNGGRNGGSTVLDPNRTTESCSRYGTTKVYPSGHSSICYSDYDGYYHVSFGHHHHK